MDRHARRAVRRRVRARRMDAARRRWVQNTLDAQLPEALADRVPGWMHSPRGRVLTACLAVVALLCWALIFALILL